MSSIQSQITRHVMMLRNVTHNLKKKKKSIMEVNQK